MHKFIVRVKHDKGYTNIHTMARNAEAAKDIIMASEKCPLSAIRSVRYAPITPSELACRLRGTRDDSKFFSRENMKFSGDTMNNYGVRSQPVLVKSLYGERLCWELYRRRPVKHGMRGSVFFDINTLHQIFPYDC